MAVIWKKALFLEFSRATRFSSLLSCGTARKVGQIVPIQVPALAQFICWLDKKRMDWLSEFWRNRSTFRDWHENSISNPYKNISWAQKLRIFSAIFYFLQNWMCLDLIKKCSQMKIHNLKKTRTGSPEPCAAEDLFQERNKNNQILDILKQHCSIAFSWAKMPSFLDILRHHCRIAFW